MFLTVHEWDGWGLWQEVSVRKFPDIYAHGLHIDKWINVHKAIAIPFSLPFFVKHFWCLYYNIQTAARVCPTHSTDPLQTLCYITVRFWTSQSSIRLTDGRKAPIAWTPQGDTLWLGNMHKEGHTMSVRGLVGVQDDLLWQCDNIFNIYHYGNIVRCCTKCDDSPAPSLTGNSGTHPCSPIWKCPPFFVAKYRFFSSKRPLFRDKTLTFQSKMNPLFFNKALTFQAK